MKLDPISCLYIYCDIVHRGGKKNRKISILNCELCRVSWDFVRTLWRWLELILRWLSRVHFLSEKSRNKTELKTSTRLSNWNWRRIEVFPCTQMLLYQGDGNEPHRLSILFLQHDRSFLSSMCWLFTSLNETRQLWMANKFSSAESSKCFDDFVNGNLSNEWIMNASCTYTEFDTSSGRPFSLNSRLECWLLQIQVQNGASMAFTVGSMMTNKNSQQFIHLKQQKKSKIEFLTHFSFISSLGTSRALKIMSWC